MSCSHVSQKAGDALTAETSSEVLGNCTEIKVGSEQDSAKRRWAPKEVQPDLRRTAGSGASSVSRPSVLGEASPSSGC